MIPSSYPSTFAPNGSQQMVILVLPTVVGLTKWVDYLPVKWQNSTGKENSYDNDGFLCVSDILSVAGKLAGVDYIRVFVDASATKPWSTDATGYVPINYSFSSSLISPADTTPATATAPPPSNPLDNGFVFPSALTGAWYDPSDLTTLFQDAAGTIPIVSMEQPVGLMKDKSGQNNHARQTSAASRPILSSRINLFSKTDQLLDSSWIKTNQTVTVNAGTAPDGNNTAARVLGNAGWVTQQQVSLVIGQVYTVSLSVKSNTASAQTFRLFACDDFVSANLSATTSWNRFSFSFTAASQIHHGLARNTAGVAADLLVWGFQLVMGTENENYQRVTSATDYDFTGFKKYLRFNGINSFMSINDSQGMRLPEMTFGIGLNPLTLGSREDWFGSGDGLTYQTNNYVVGNSSSNLTAFPQTPETALIFNAAVTNQKVVMSLTSDGSYVNARVNSVPFASKPAVFGTANAGGFLIGATPTAQGPVSFSGMNLYLLMLQGRKATPEQITTLENYVNSKTGAY
tara:strand:+ start:167 stop:1711 length:1545 start_codon:yes stop_codon:yes gene_type:complete